MTDMQKQFMESVIVAGRQAGQVQAKGADGEEREPTIALRMDFGG
jgi:HEAT repeat-containing protein 5